MWTARRQCAKPVHAQNLDIQPRSRITDELCTTAQSPRRKNQSHKLQTRSNLQIRRCQRRNRRTSKSWKPVPQKRERMSSRAEPQRGNIAQSSFAKSLCRITLLMHTQQQDFASYTYTYTYTHTHIRKERPREQMNSRAESLRDIMAHSSFAAKRLCRKTLLTHMRQQDSASYTHTYTYIHTYKHTYIY